MFGYVGLLRFVEVVGYDDCVFVGDCWCFGLWYLLSSFICWVLRRLLNSVVPLCLLVVVVGSSLLTDLFVVW